MSNSIRGICELQKLFCTLRDSCGSSSGSPETGLSSKSFTNSWIVWGWFFRVYTPCCREFQSYSIWIELKSEHRLILCMMHLHFLQEGDPSCLPFPISWRRRVHLEELFTTAFPLMPIWSCLHCKTIWNLPNIDSVQHLNQGSVLAWSSTGWALPNNNTEETQFVRMFMVVKADRSKVRKRNLRWILGLIMDIRVTILDCSVLV
jgi:hypothetical protein